MKKRIWVFVIGLVLGGGAGLIGSQAITSSKNLKKSSYYSANKKSKRPRIKQRKSSRKVKAKGRSHSRKIYRPAKSRKRVSRSRRSNRRAEVQQELLKVHASSPAATLAARKQLPETPWLDQSNSNFTIKSNENGDVLSISDVPMHQVQLVGLSLNTDTQHLRGEWARGDGLERPRIYVH